MSTTKLLTGWILVLAVLFAQVGTVFASPAVQDTTAITGTIVSVTPVPDENGVITAVLVTFTDETGQEQSVRISLAAADLLGLVEVDPVTNQVTVLAQPGDPITIDPTTVIPEEEEDVHPISAILASFFGMDAGEVNAMHEDGFGFGVIAQALWMAKNLEGEEITAGMILQAKRDHDFSSFTLPDGTTPKNWGQFKKAVLEKKNNLGVIVSGHAENGESEEALNENGNGRGNGNGYGRDNNPGKGKGKNKNP